MDLIEKLKGMPTVYFLNLPESVDRKFFMVQQEKSLPIKFVRWEVQNHFRNRQKFKTPVPMELDPTTINSHTNSINFQLAVTNSYIRLLQQWYDHTEEEYAIFCDDDMDFSSVKHWSFTWSEFMDSLPPEWDAIQMIRMRMDLNLEGEWTKAIDEEIEPIMLKRKLAPHCVPNFQVIHRRKGAPNVGGSVHLMNRKYVGRILEKYIIDKDVTFSEEDTHYGAEDLLLFGTKVYNIPFFTERAEMLSTLKHTYPYIDVANEAQDRFYNTVHTASQMYYTYFWETHGSKIKLDMLWN